MPDPTPDLPAVCDALTAAGDAWPTALPARAQIVYRDHPHQRDRVTIGEATLYRDDEDNVWHVLGWSNASRARFLPRRRPLHLAGTPAPPLPEPHDGDHAGWS